MKKTIIIAIAMTMVMTLVGCGEKGEPQVISNTLEEHFLTETILEETIIEEDIIEEDWIASDGHKYNMTRDEYNQLINGYQNGDISKEYLEEMLFNSRIG